MQTQSTKRIHLSHEQRIELEMLAMSLAIALPAAYRLLREGKISLSSI